MDNQSIEKRLQCLGYFGFGGGYGQVVGAVGADGAIYCNSCPLSQQCWEKHRDRVRTLMPELTTIFDRMSEQFRGAVLMKTWNEFYQAPDPYTAVLMGNMEDGLRVGHGEPVVDRGDGTVPYPFSSVQ